MTRDERLEQFQEALGYHFSDPALLDLALVHRSILHEDPKSFPESNERLEFLGDAVLEWISTDYLYRHFPEEPEGELSKIRAYAVCEASFSHLGRSIGLPEFLILGNGEESTGGRNKDSLIADALEALCGAIYLDGGSDFLWCWFRERLEEMEPHLMRDEEVSNPKSLFQERMMKQGREFSYRLISEAGPPHRKTFQMALEIDGRQVAVGQGSSKKRAEMDAAAKALQWLKEREQ